ncbi:Glycosyltransferase involved in cell wall bisynthesis [Granulicella rosea]|uniref:Glycosyltransferase involved in cell wall bisynthesis n=2 Tax=Granulicella rosea TaxID=474952 RepID=A0A239KTH7_9BACT|nr:Glycosyltransferase involved in cell wall bisynthesis [Granulicella rosea]
MGHPAPTVSLRLSFELMTSQLKHLLLTTVEDAFDPKSWSGIPYSLRAALERRVERLTVFRPGPPMRHPVEVAKRLILGGNPPKHPLWMTVPALKRTASEVRAEIQRVQPDAVLSISSQCVAYLERRGFERGPATAPQIFMFSDAPWLAWRQAYERWEPMPRWAARYAEDEARAARGLDGLCFGSQWACGEALRLYSQSGTRRDLGLSERLHVTPLGANWTPSIGREELMARVRERSRSDMLELLFVGRDWERKGGPLAVEVARQMQQAGQPVRLHLVGCRPKLPESMICAKPGEGGFVTVHGLLRQDVPEESAALEELFLRSHFLVVPTLAECYGIAFVEAQAFALPPVSRAVDALPSVIADGVTGLVFPDGARASAYVERMLTLWRDREAYIAMAETARARFEADLSWDRTADGIVTAMERLLPGS